MGCVCGGRQRAPRNTVPYLPGPAAVAELKNYHAVDADVVAELLGSSFPAGLPPEAAAGALRRDGPNCLAPPRDWPLPAKFASAMFSGFAPLLWVGVVTSFVAWQPVGGTNASPYSLGLALLLLAIIVAG